MKNNTKKLFKAGIVLCIAVLLVGLPATAINSTPEKPTFASSTQTTTPSGVLGDQVELKYYEESGLSNVIGITTSPATWKTAIRLTQDEMAPYMTWTMTAVNVAFSADNGHPDIDIKIYIYDEGTQTAPGPVIVSDTTYHLDTTGVTTVPLVTPVNLSGHDELWVAVEWYQIYDPPCYYAWSDCLTGPSIPYKSDWTYLNNVWQQLHVVLPTVDGRWGIGAIVEGEGLAELSIANIKGPIGIKADVQNIGETDANNVEWTIKVTGGLLKMVNVSEMGTEATLASGGVLPIGVGMFIGFGKINIAITAKADNALQVSASKSAFLLGPLVVGIK